MVPEEPVTRSTTSPLVVVVVDPAVVLVDRAVVVVVPAVVVVTPVVVVDDVSPLLVVVLDETAEPLPAERGAVVGGRGAVAVTPDTLASLDAAAVVEV